MGSTERQPCQRTTTDLIDGCVRHLTGVIQCTPPDHALAPKLEACLRYTEVNTCTRTKSDPDHVIVTLSATEVSSGV